MRYKMEFQNLFLLLFFSTSCVISPWVKEKYVDNRISQMSLIDNIPDYDKYLDFYVNEAFILVNIRGDDKIDSFYNEHSPYSVVLSIQGDMTYHKEIILNSIMIRSNHKENYIYRNVEKKEFDLIPVKWSNQKNIYEFGQCFYRVDKDFYFDFKSNEIITIELNITVNGTNSTETKTINYVFKPKKVNGIFKSLRV